MNTNYDSARYALLAALLSCDGLAHPPLDSLLPPDATREVCWPDELVSCLQSAGVDAVLIETGAPEWHMEFEFRRGALCLMLSGKHSAPVHQRWIAAFRSPAGLLCGVEGGFDEPSDLCLPFHLLPVLIAVRGIKDVPADA